MIRQCQTCGRHYPIPFLLQKNDPECPYVRCGIDQTVHPKWDECDDWKENKMTNNEIKKAIGKPALYEGLAEEATELAHAALKMARILRGENPTPALSYEVRNAVIEEYSDLKIYLDILDIQISAPIYTTKVIRMIDRIQEAKE